ncbi:MAG: cache domain-containing protein [Candidatus Hydrogenedentes bacterium]|nr:cache domain-containing protein [Candidatus Hydrogenedentota bacterium]
MKRTLSTRSVQVVLPAVSTLLLYALAVFIVIIPSIKSYMMAGERRLLQELMSNVVTLLASYETRVQSGELTREDAQARAMERVRSIRYGPELKDYFWINDLGPAMIMHPYRPDMEGEDLSDYADPNGTHLFVEAVRLTRAHGEGFIEYVWQRHEDEARLAPKLSYVKLFEPWGWVIGTGIYVDHVDENIAAITGRLAIASGVVLVLIAALSLYTVYHGLRVDRERERVAQALARSEETATALLNAPPDAAFLLDPRGTVLGLNQTGATQLRRPRARLLGANVFAALPPELAEAGRARMADVMRSGNAVQFEHRFDGRVFMFHVFPLTESRGQVTRVAVYARDITKRKRAEETLLRDEQRLEALVGLNEAGDAPVHVLIELAANAAAELTGSEAAYLGLVDEEQAAISVYCGRSKEAQREPLRAGLLDGDSAWGKAARERTSVVENQPASRESPSPWCGRRVARSLTVPVVDRGRLVVVAGVADKQQDYDDADARQLALFIEGVWRVVLRRRADDALTQRTQELEQANEELVRKNKDLDEFTYVASHDLQEPLRKLIAFGKMLPDDLPGELPERARKDLEFIVDAADRMQSLVRDLLNLSRAGRTAFVTERVPLGDCVERALVALAARIEESGAQIEQGVLPDVQGDPRLLTQLYQNLISNAIKFVQGAPPRVQITVEDHNGVAVFGVRDNGIGINPEYTEQIFAPFRRLHGRSEYDGSGIGLAICRKVVQRHGGAIWVESEPGVGSHFKFTLHEPGKGEP